MCPLPLTWGAETEPQACRASTPPVRSIPTLLFHIYAGSSLELVLVEEFFLTFELRIRSGYSDSSGLTVTVQPRLVLSVGITSHTILALNVWPSCLSFPSNWGYRYEYISILLFIYF